MRKIKILLTRKYYDIDKLYIVEKLANQLGDAFELIDPLNYSEDSLCNVVKDIDVLFGPFVSKKLLENAQNLKLIQIPWTGLDGFDFTTMKDFKYPVCNSHSNSTAVSEFAVSLTLDLAKKINFHDRQMRQNNWNRSGEIMNLKSRMISGSKVCILGYGNIGRKIGKILNAFGANILAVMRTFREYPEVDESFQSDDWIKAVQMSDIVICTLPLTDKTNGMINESTIKYFNSNSVIVNVSRAEIFDEVALYDALKNNRIAGYASDVWWQSPSRGNSNSSVSANFKYESLENVLLSPHRAGFIDGVLPHLDDAINNLINLAQNKPLINMIDIDKNY